MPHLADLATLLSQYHQRRRIFRLKKSPEPWLQLGYEQECEEGRLIVF